MAELRTERLILRQWRESDLDPFARLNADAEVMEHFPETLTRERSDRGALAAKAAIERHGHGFWAVEIPGEADFIGFIGLQQVHDDVPFVPAVEIGWRLDKPFWGRGWPMKAPRRRSPSPSRS
ncbi:MAG TPA: GNAT family N-acetyltransferase [Solirubrobacteraceae bacterium]|jgi:3-dehydroquinate dehydratase/shikimate dehydrogenase